MVESSYLGSMLRVVMFGCFAGLSSCAPGFDDTISLADVKKANEGVVFLNVTYAGRPCRTGNIVLATEPSPGRYVLHSGPMIGGITSAAINPRQITLAAGRYHVGSLQCMVDDKMLAIGPHDGTVVVGNPLQSLASFSISSGEVVNLGQINITPTDYRADNGTISILDIDPAAMKRLQISAPLISSKMVTKLMTVTSKGTSYKFEWVVLGRR